MTPSDPPRIRVYCVAIEQADIETVRMMENAGLIKYKGTPLKERYNSYERMRVLEATLISNSKDVIDHVWSQLKPTRELFGKEKADEINNYANRCLQQGRVHSMEALLEKGWTKFGDPWANIKFEDQACLVPLINKHFPINAARRKVLTKQYGDVACKMLKALTAVGFDMTGNLPLHATDHQRRESFDFLMSQEVKPVVLTKAMHAICTDQTSKRYVEQFKALLYRGAQILPDDLPFVLESHEYSPVYQAYVKSKSVLKQDSKQCTMGQEVELL